MLNRSIIYSAKLTALINSASAFAEVVEFTLSTDVLNRRTNTCISRREACERRTRTSVCASRVTAAVRPFLTASRQSFVEAETFESIGKKQASRPRPAASEESQTAALRLYVLQMFREGEKILVKPRMTSTRHSIRRNVNEILFMLR